MKLKLFLCLTACSFLISQLHAASSNSTRSTTLSDASGNPGSPQNYFLDEQKVVPQTTVVPQSTPSSVDQKTSTNSVLSQPQLQVQTQTNGVLSPQTSRGYNSYNSGNTSYPQANYIHPNFNNPTPASHPGIANNSYSNTSVQYASQAQGSYAYPGVSDACCEEAPPCDQPCGDCYCLYCHYRPCYYYTTQCEYIPQYEYQRNCRYVPENYCETRCRMVPENYQVTRCKMVPQYYQETKCCERQCYDPCTGCCQTVPQYYCETCCRQVPQYYQETCCRQVPQYYQENCCRYVPQYYYTCQCKYCPKYSYQRHCKYVPQYYYKHECNNPSGGMCAPSCCQ